jgi:predicted helicase
MTEYNSGIQTKRDKLTIKFNKEGIEKVKENIKNLDISILRDIYNLPKDGRDWRLDWAKQDITNNNPKIVDILYRPFDIRKTLFTGKTKGFLAYPRAKTTGNFISDNLGLITVRQQSTYDFQHILVSKYMIESGAISLQTKEWGYIFPLYIYDGYKNRKVNFNPNILSKITNIIGEREPEEILDYIYAILHSPNYREKYKEFLKIDFPRIPYPEDRETFDKLVLLGSELRQLHLMESPKLHNFITTYPIDGSNEVEKITYKDSNVYINKEQYFGNVSDIAWNFYIGGYQPAQKWLKDRRGRTLENSDIEHYQQVIVALVETSKIMKKIDTIKTF